MNLLLKELAGMPYQVQKGDTIAKVLTMLKVDWKTLRHLNPEALKRSSKTGNWFLREGSIVKSKDTFEAVLNQKAQAIKTTTLQKKAAASEKWTEYTIKPGDTLWSLAVKKFHVNLDDLIKDNKIKDPRKIRPGQIIRIRQPIRTEMRQIVASWYGTSFHGRAMANGDRFDMYADTIAHRQLPLGTRVELENPQTGQKAKAVVTDRGPYVAGRDVDLSYGLAQKLNLVKRGVGSLVMRVLG